MIRYHLLTPTAYSDTRFTHIEKVEKTIPWAYLDSVGVPTIGIGYNLRDLDNVLPAVLAAFGLNPDDGRLTSPEQQAREQYYMDRITQAALSSWVSTDALRTFLNDTMQMRAQDDLLASLGTGREPDFE